MRACPTEEFIVINRIAFSFLAALLACSALAVELTDAQRAAIEERIKPVARVAIAGQDNTSLAPPAAADAVAATASADLTGEQVYNQACVACHGAGVAGAPKLGDKAAWAPRIAQGLDMLKKGGLFG